MVLPLSEIKAQMSYAYVHAVASRVGFTIKPETVDYDGIDVTVKTVGYIDNDRRYKRSNVLDLQLKSTAVDINDGEDISFELKIKNYNDLRDGNRAVPALLVVYILPRNETEWLTHSDNLMVSRRCAYWCNLKGEPQVSNVRSVTVNIPRRNLFSPESLKEIMVRLARTGEIGYTL